MAYKRVECPGHNDYLRYRGEMQMSDIKYDDLQLIKRIGFEKTALRIEGEIQRLTNELAKANERIALQDQTMLGYEAKIQQLKSAQGNITLP